MTGNIASFLSLSEYSRIGVDTNIFIYSFSSHSEFGQYANKIFEFADTYQRKIITSIITYIELLSIPVEAEPLEVLEEAFLSMPQLEVVDIGLKVAQKAADIRRQYSFKVPDSLQLASACIGEADVFITQDNRLKKFKELPIIGLT